MNAKAPRWLVPAKPGELPATKADVRLILERLEALQAALVAAQQPRRPSFADHDRELVLSIIGALGGKEFRAHQLVDYATDASLQNARLRTAIVAAIGALSSKRIGKRLKALAGVDLGGVMVVRQGESRTGALWCARELR